MWNIVSVLITQRMISCIITAKKIIGALIAGISMNNFLGMNRYGTIA